MRQASTKTTRGFSIVELLIIIMVLGAIGALVLYNFSAVNAKDRDTQRKVEIDALAAQLEDCYKAACKNTYPSLLNLQDDEPGGWLETYMPNLNKNLLRDLQSNTIQAGTPSNGAEYQYEPTCTGDPSKVVCTAFKLRAYLETDPTNYYVKSSLNR